MRPDSPFILRSSGFYWWRAGMTGQGNSGRPAGDAVNGTLRVAGWKVEVNQVQEAKSWRRKVHT
jgi:hypothetical protein